jgi:deoxyguanosine kinase
VTGEHTHASGPRFIAVEGPIGAGKSSLARILAEELGAALVEEQPDENPFLAAFYRDPPHHALATQLHFLMERYAQQRALAEGELRARKGVVSDYFFPKDRLFATLTLSPEELALYDRIYRELSPRIVAPDLVVYLQARTEVLLERIARRGRAAERPIRAEYVRDVADAYTRFFFGYTASPLLIVNASEIDFVHHEEDRRALLEVVRATRTGVNHWSRS